MYDHLYPKFEELLIELVLILYNKIPTSLLEDMEFFIMEPYMVATCSTNTKLAFNLGKQISISNEINSVAIMSLYMLFLARDSMLKLFPVSTVEEALGNSKNLLTSYKLLKQING